MNLITKLINLYEDIILAHTRANITANIKRKPKATSTESLTKYGKNTKVHECMKYSRKQYVINIEHFFVMLHKHVYGV